MSLRCIDTISQCRAIAFRSALLTTEKSYEGSVLLVGLWPALAATLGGFSK